MQERGAVGPPLEVHVFRGFAACGLPSFHPSFHHERGPADRGQPGSMMHAAGAFDAQLFDALPVPALACDASGHIVRCNRAAQRCVPGLVTDDGLRQLRQLGADEAARGALQAALAEALRQGHADCLAVTLMLAQPGAGPGDAGAVPCRVDVSIDRLPGGGDGPPPAGLVTWSPCPKAEDGDRHAASQAALDALRADMEAAVAASQAKSRFLSRMGHELRTPLNAVLGFTQLMRSEIEAADAQPETQLAQLEFIEQAGWQLLTMIDNVLDLARIEGGRLDLHLERLSLTSALDEALSLVDAAVRRRQLRVVRLIPAALPEVTADRARLRQVLLVLLDQAARSSVEHGEVSLVAQAEGDFVRLAVNDGGPGLDAARHEALQAAFDVPGAAAEGDGVGVSLSIARQIVLAMGGRFALDSTPGLGSTFSVLLPLARASGRTGGA